MLHLIFEQTEKYSYRDPAAFIKDGVIYLFFTLVENTNDGQYFYVAESKSTDFIHWSEPVILTEKDNSKNYSSPGNVVEYNGNYYLCLQTYPRPNGETYGNYDSRIFTMKSKDLIHWDEPEILMVKGNVPIEAMGRMIDPYILKDNGIFRCFFKQNGVSFSTSTDLKNWEFQGSTECGENVCVLKQNEEYFIFHSPENGIGLLKTKDFKGFENCGVTTLKQSEWRWAKDRVTAGFVLELPKDYKYRYAVFFHGDNEEKHLFGASLAVIGINSLIELFNNLPDKFRFIGMNHAKRIIQLGICRGEI